MASAVLVGAGLLVGPAQARPLARCQHRTLHQDIKQADVVFRGVVDEVRPVRGKGDQRRRTYKVGADRVYQSSLAADTVVVTASVGAACSPPTLRRGKRYMFFAVEKGSQLLSTSATAPARRHLTRQVVAELGGGQPPRPKPSATTVAFSRAADASPPSLSRLMAPGAALVILSLLGLVVLARLGRRTT